MNRKTGVKTIILLIVILFVTIAFSGIVQSAPPISQVTIIVDIHGNGDYTSINEAILSANITDKILIRKGVYIEHDIVIDKKIEVIGEDFTNTIINCSGNIAFSLASSYVDISNLQIINTGEFAIIIQIGRIGCTITNCTINTLNNGIAIDIRSSYNTISDCKLIGVDNSKQGIKIHGANNIVRNCEIQDFSNGVLILLDSNNNEIINCNIINNENAVDIRINSNNNVVTSCNIYYNLQSVRIWQNSNNNYLYLNNFWKNDIVAIDECNNTWDNGIKGNYWDKYRGVDANEDGIGDTPFVISNGIVDRYPIISMILPDIVTDPADVRLISSKSDDTPTFTWSPSVYINGVKGYYVKIDSDTEIFIGNVTTWTATKPQFNGFHKFYVRGEGKDNKTSSYSIITYIIDTSILDTDGDGWSDVEEELYGTDPNDFDNYPLDTDGDHIPDSVDTDNDNDGLSDSIETDLGSNPKNGQDVIKIYSAGKQYHLVDLNQNGIFDILYNPTNEFTTVVEKSNNSYLIDINGDNVWDYVYNIKDGSISTYSEKLSLSDFLWFIIILVIVLPILIIIYYYLRKKQKKVIKKSLNKEPYGLPISDKKDTLEMFTNTKAVLQNIQKNVEVYMEKLNEIEEQFILPGINEKKEVKPFEEKQNKVENIYELEAKVDQILLKYHYK